MKLKWSGHTDKGSVRSNNEDAFLALTFDAREVRLLGKVGEASLEAADFVFAVSDGMGGAKSGEFASKIATEKITRLLPRSFKLSAEGMEAGRADVLVELFTAIHQEMQALGRYYDECRGMGATLSLCWFSPGWMFFSHLGDSRIYYLPHEGPMKQVTEDHTFVGYQLRRGLITEREARVHPGKSRLQKVLGASMQIVDPHLGSVRTEVGDRFLICSDGIVDGLWDHHVADAMREGWDAVKMVQEAIQAGGRDNATALLVEVA
jgi:PPM family protein phosphatase